MDCPGALIDCICHAFRTVDGDKDSISADETAALPCIACWASLTNKERKKRPQTSLQRRLWNTGGEQQVNETSFEGTLGV